MSNVAASAALQATTIGPAANEPERNPAQKPAVSTLDGAPSAEEVDEDGNDSENDEDMNESPRDVKREETQSPANEKDDSDRE